MKIRVNSSPITAKVISSGSESRVVSVGIQGPSGLSQITSATDVDATNLQDGSVLVYKTQTNKWTSTTTLEAQNMEGGEF